MPIELVPLGTLTIIIERQTLLRTTPQGGLLVGEAADCRWEGERVRARQLGRSASDWVRLHADASVSVDARILLRTDDGATIALTYRGKAAKPPGEGGVVYTTPMFETDDERYAWLNAVQAVGIGRRAGNVLVYEMYALDGPRAERTQNSCADGIHQGRPPARDDPAADTGPAKTR